MTSLRIELLGSFRIALGDATAGSINTNRLRSLLAYLILHRDAPQSREHLAFLLWPESEESQARTNLRQLLHHLRRALPDADHWVVTDTQTIQWNPGAVVAIDVAEFETALSRAEQAARERNIGAEREALVQAANVYKDDLTPELYDDWLQQPRERLRKRLASGLSRLASLLEASGEYPAAIGFAERLVAQDPLTESHYHQLMRLHSLNQDRAAAIRVYHQCMKTLKRDLGLSPGAATRELFERLLKSDAGGVKRPAEPAETRPSAPDSPLPLIGRRDSYQGLRLCWNRAVQGGSLLATVEGEAGIGKSRLAEELFGSISSEGASAARTRCYAAQGQLAYAPLADLLRTNTVRAALSKLPRRQLSELARLLPELLADDPEIPLPQPLTESWQRHHFYEALLVAFRSVPKPLLVWIDDLQWCDRDTIEWLEHLLRTEASGGILLLGTVRTEDTAKDHPLRGLCRQLQQSRQLEVLEIGPLSAAETTALAAQIAHHKPDDDRAAQLYRETHGNPLYVVESVRARLEAPGQARASTSVVHSVITERLSRLSPAAFELSEIAAAMGTSFTFELLAKATDWDEDSLTAALDELWQRRIIHAQGAHSYDFTHDRLRETAYAEQSLVRRRSMHRRIARALEDLFSSDPDAASGQLASQYESAGMGEQAISYYHRSAKVAQRRFADVEAVTLLKKSLALCQELPPGRKRDQTELELLVTLAPSLRATLGHAAAEAGEVSTRALEIARQTGEHKHLLPVLAGAWLFHVVRGDLTIARDLSQSFLKTAGEQNSAIHISTGHVMLGSSLFHLGDFEGARKHLEESTSVQAEIHAQEGGLVLAPNLGLDVVVFSYAYLAHVLWHVGDRRQAAAQSARAIARAEEISHPFSLAIARTYASMLHLFGSEYAEARAQAEQAIEVCARYHFAYYGATATILAGAAAALDGDVPNGLAQLRRGLEDFRSTGAEIRLPFYYSLLARVCDLAGLVDVSTASVALGQAFERKNSETWATRGRKPNSLSASEY